jgi:hypothetical protein
LYGTIRTGYFGRVTRLEVKQMKRVITIFITMCLAVTQLPAFASEMTATSEKDLCLLYSEMCANRALTIQEKIAKLNGEIAKGTQVYTKVELQRLQNKLEEAEDLLYNLLYGAGSHMGAHRHR